MDNFYAYLKKNSGVGLCEEKAIDREQHGGGITASLFAKFQKLKTFKW